MLDKQATRLMFFPEMIDNPWQWSCIMEEKILELMKKHGDALSAGQIADLLGADRKEVDKAMKTLKKEERIVSPNRCYWTAA